MTTIYCPLNHWLIKLSEGWNLCGLAPQDERGYSVMMWRAG